MTTLPAVAKTLRKSILQVCGGIGGAQNCLCHARERVRWLQIVVESVAHIFPRDPWGYV
jgi:hypothetical protein